MKRYITLPILLLLTTFGARAAGSNDSLYVALNGRIQELRATNDSLTRVMTQYRSEYSMGKISADKITQLEMRLFDLRSEQNSVEVKLLRLHAPAASAKESPAMVVDNARSISTSRIAKEKLPAKVLRSLKQADANEAACKELRDEYESLYRRIRTLSELYQQSDKESEAIPYYKEAEELQGVVDSLNAALNEAWGKIYSDKSFAYSMLIEMLGYEDLITKSVDLTRKATAKRTELTEGVTNSAAIEYHLHKSEMVAIERELARKLSLKEAADSLTKVSKALAKGDSSIEDMEDVTITERNFIRYDAIKFSSSATYTKSKPIPKAEEYKRGTIFRIQLGAFKQKQLPTIFRGAYPLSYDLTFGFWTYYAGGFETLAEAEVGAEQCRRRGFKRPEIVMWRDGVRRNLYREPLPKSNGCRMVIDGRVEFTPEMEALIKRYAGEANLSRIGNDKYVLGTVADPAGAESLKEEMVKLDPEMTITINEL